MENFCVVTPEKVDSPVLRKFVESRGGYWNPEATLDQGVIERGRARIFISAIDRVGSCYDEGELEKLEELLGAPPNTVIDIEIGHAEGSRELAEGFVRDVMARWGGYFDDNISALG